MSHRRVQRALFIAAAAISVALAGCSSDASDATPSTGAQVTSSTTASREAPASTPSTEEKTYALLDDPSWTLQEAIDLRADEPAVTIEQPPLDWYAEYVPASGADAQVLLTGYAVPLDEARRQSEMYGFQFEDVNVDGWQAVGSSGPGASSEPPAVVLLRDGDRSVRLLSYDLSLSELTRLAAGVTRTDTAGWIGVGGAID